MLEVLSLLAPVMPSLFTISVTALAAWVLIPASKKREAQAAARRNIHQLSFEYRSMVWDASPDIWFLDHPATGLAIARKMASYEWCVEFGSRIMKESACLTIVEQELIKDRTAKLIGQPAFMSALQKVDMSQIPVNDYHGSGELMSLFDLNADDGWIAVRSPEKALSILNELAQLSPRVARWLLQKRSRADIVLSAFQRTSRWSVATVSKAWKATMTKRFIHREVAD